MLVTGAGTGMGLEVATEFGRRGSRVIMVARHEDRLRREGERLADAVALPCDIADEQQVTRLLGHLRQEPDLDTVSLNAEVRHTYSLFGGQDAVAHAEAVAELFDGLDRDELELHVGSTADVYEALRTSPDAAVRRQRHHGG